MAAFERNTSSPRSERPNGGINIPDEEKVPFGDLPRRFAQDATALVQNEIALAKLELRDSITTYARDVARMGAAAGVGLVGLLALTAFLVVGLGDLIDNYWLSALFVAVVLLAIAGVMARAALARMRQSSIAPDAATRLINRSHEDKSLNQTMRDADRAGGFEPGSNFDLSPRRDAMGDPLGRISSELPVEGER